MQSESRLYTLRPLQSEGIGLLDAATDAVVPSSPERRCHHPKCRLKQRTYCAGDLAQAPEGPQRNGKGPLTGAAPTAALAASVVSPGHLLRWSLCSEECSSFGYTTAENAPLPVANTSVEWMIHFANNG